MNHSHDNLAALMAAFQGGSFPPPPEWRGHPLRRRRRGRPVTYRVRLDLLDARPPIWRRLDLASDLTLDEVSDVVQIAMGWTDSHLHAFSAGGRPFMPGSFRFLNDYDVEERETGTHEADVRFDEVLTEPGDRLWYEYDFGDGWTHVLRLEKVLPRAETRATCLTGRRACPPEDCGGVPGYEELLAYLDEPASATEWAAESFAHYFPDGDFDPEAFDVDDVNNALGQVRSRPS